METIVIYRYITRLYIYIYMEITALYRYIAMITFLFSYTVVSHSQSAF